MPELYFQDYPGPSGQPPLVLLHGLFGSGANWRGVAKRIAGGRRVLVMDMRNHGRSFHHRAMTYPLMARDVLDTLDGEGIERADLLGHSMGGKAAMVAAIENPDRVGRLIVVDIAPVVYTHSHTPLIDAMLGIDVSALKSRGAADGALAPSIDDAMIRQFLMQSLEKAEQGYRWRLNLDALKHGMGDLTGFPDLDDGVFDGSALFVYGENSDYVQPEHRPRIGRYFPDADYAALADAGHWVHADNPDALIAQIERFLEQ